MELARVVDEELDKENVAPALAPVIRKPSGGSGRQKLSEDDSTDCLVVESSASDHSHRASPLPGILSSASLAHVEGKDEDADAGANEAVSKKKKRKKKKKKKKPKNPCGDADVEMLDATKPAGEVKEAVGEEQAKAISGDKSSIKEDEPAVKDETANEDEEAVKEDEAVMEDEAAGKEDKAVMEDEAAEEEDTKEEGELEESGGVPGFDVLDDAAVLAVGRRPLLDIGSSSGSEREAEHCPVYDEEYVTVDEEAPAPLTSVPEVEGEVEEDASPELVPGNAEVEAKPFEEPDEAMMARIVKQVEFYFSDANILKDYFLLRRVRKNKEGWVRIALLANFKLVQIITKDCRQVAFALKHKSTFLETDDDCLRVRRRGGLPTWDHHVYKRTCLVYGFDRQPPRRGRTNNAPPEVNVQTIREKLFPKFDLQILLVRILKPGREIPLDLKTCVRNHPQLGEELCVVVEFDTVPTAENARSYIDGRRWHRSHRLWAKILGKRPRLPEEWAARFGAQRAELLQQQRQQQTGHRQHREFLQQLYYQQQQQQFLEELQRRRWADKKVSYADSVRGKKRPAPESYADKVRGAKSDAETAEEQPEQHKQQQQPAAPRVRARAKKASGEARSHRKAEKAAKQKPVSYAAAAGRASTEGTNGSPQEAPAPSERKERIGLTLLREPRGPDESGNGSMWMRRGPGAADKPVGAGAALDTAVKAVAMEAEADTAAKAVEMEPKADTPAEAVETKAAAEAEAIEIEPKSGTNTEAVEIATEAAEMDTEAVELAMEAADMDVASPGPSGKGLVRRRSVRELVRKFEALSTASPGEEEHAAPRRLSVTPRANRDALLDDLTES